MNGFCGIHRRPISQEILIISIRKMGPKKTIKKFLPYLSGANEGILVWFPLCRFTYILSRWQVHSMKHRDMSLTISRVSEETVPCRICVLLSDESTRNCKLSFVIYVGETEDCMIILWSEIIPTAIYVACFFQRNQISRLLDAVAPIRHYSFG